jgi:hypothetical protein
MPVERLKAQVVKDPSGVTISSRVVKKGTGENLLWELRWEPGAPWGAGTWVAFRDGLGRLRELRIILLEGTDGSDHKVAQPGTWVRLVPQGRGSRLDLLVAGRLVSGGWTVGSPLLDVLSSSDSWLWDETSSDFDWSSLLPQRRWEDEKVEALQSRVHKLLSTVPEARNALWWPDPASGRNGETSTGAPWGTWTTLGVDVIPGSRGLGPWGVSLWVTDGVLRGWKADYPTWNSLLEPRIELPGYSRALVPEDPTTEPGFGLDWARNLGLAVFHTLYPHRPLTNDAADVSGLPYLEFVPGAGYPTDAFPALVHLLAVTKPGTAYLAAVSTQQAADRGAASATAFREPAVILPWVGTDQRVRVAVWAGPKELTWDQWLALGAVRKGVRPDHVALVALPLPPTVELPLLPAR